MPKRIQRTRSKGWRMPENTRYVGRSTRWGNPFMAGETTPADWPEPFGGVEVRDRGHAVDLLEQLVGRAETGLVPELPGYPGFPSLSEIRQELQGLDLACWCPLTEPCHADLLIRLANDVDPERFREREIRIYAGATDDLGYSRGDDLEEEEGDRDL